MPTESLAKKIPRKRLNLCLSVTANDVKQATHRNVYSQRQEKEKDEMRFDII